jgi:hypothetical protein
LRRNGRGQLAELCRRGLLLPRRLDDVLPLVYQVRIAALLSTPTAPQCTPPFAGVLRPTVHDQNRIDHEWKRRVFPVPCDHDFINLRGFLRR